MFHNAVSTTATSGANAAGKAELTGSGTGSYMIYGFSVIVSDAATTPASAVTIKDGTTVIYSDIIPATSAIGARIQRDFTCPIKGTPGNLVSLNCAALGASSKSVLNLLTEFIP